MVQARSEFEGRVSDKGVVAGIYFRTNDRRLDRQDRRVLGRVAKDVKIELAIGKVPELWLVAETDRQGDEAYNQKLSDLRLKVVAEHLGKLLAGERSFTHVWAFSAGESVAAGSRYSGKDGTADAYRRRVLIFAREPMFRIDGKRLDHKRYELRRGFVRQSPPAEIKMDQLPGGFEW